MYHIKHHKRQSNSVLRHTLLLFLNLVRFKEDGAAQDFALLRVNRRHPRGSEDDLGDGQLC